MIAIALSIIIWSTLAASLFVTIMFMVNLLLFRKASSEFELDSVSKLETGSLRQTATHRVSVLIPARNEALRIGPLLDSVLASQGVQCDICVLDDESQDGTDAIVLNYSNRHANVRLLRGATIPVGWSGKQYACYQLAQQAMFEDILFIDADVCLSGDAILRALAYRNQSGVDLLSGFPRQRVESMGEKLLIPLIHVILLCFLPFVLMRWTRMTGAAAGCGQFFLTSKRAYQRSGGHRVIRQSLHDGIMLPRAYRQAGLKTDIFDASDVASCRMYTSFEETWLGLLKNASEGFARFPQLPVITLLMLLAFVCPVFCLFGMSIGLVGQEYLWIVLTSFVLSYVPRVLCCLKFDHAWSTCLLNPISIGLFLVIQWSALMRKSRGQHVQWRQRNYTMVTS